MPFDPLKLANYPSDAGVYLMKSGETILYIGKARNLKQRIKQYFSPGRDARAIIPFLVSKITDIETIVVTSEKEALLLENTLIKKFTPRYNALLKDDKTYIALKVTTKDEWPTVRLVRYKGKPKEEGLYFGPYTSAFAARKTLDLLNRVFPLRQCSDQELARRTRPCILYQMKRCIAPCVGYCSKAEYDQYVEKTIRFLRGQDKEVLQELYEEMHQLSEKLEFEKAAAILRTIRQIESTIEVQRVDKPLGIDLDAWGIYREAEDLILSRLIFRNGKLTGSMNYDYSNIAQEDSELFPSFLIQEYERQEDFPQEILVPFEIEENEALSEIISGYKGKKVGILNPKRGEKLALVEMAARNAKATFQKEKDEEVVREKILLQMQEQFQLTQYPERIECVDTSNLSGSEPVASIVAYTDGFKDTSRYRKYKLNIPSKPDDYGAMYEVLMRRYKKGKEENDLPDLLIVDGGKGQLNVAAKVFEELNIITVNMIALTKEQGRHDKGLRAEQVYIPNTRDPIVLKTTSPILFFIQQIRDEAHRFAISFQRKRRTKKTLVSALDSIEGIGPAKKRALLRHFGSVKNIRDATEEQLKEVKILSQTNIRDILMFFQQNL